MAFKLGNKPLPGIAHGGKLNKKHGFKIERRKLGDGILGEAHPGRVVIDKNVKPGSAQEQQVISHEGQHVKDMASGKAAFGKDWVRWEGKTYKRKDGKIKYNGTWDNEGSEKFPWEKSALKAESPLKHPGTREDHPPTREGGTHGHPEEFYKKEEATVASDEETSRLVEGERSAEKTAVLLHHINAARKEQGLPPVTTLEEGLKTTPSGG